jgi:hypothetical protein
MAYTTDLVSSNLSLLKTYADEAFSDAQRYLDELNEYIVAEIITTPPDIIITTPDSITIDPSLAAEMPASPDSSEFGTPPDAPTTSEHDFPNAPTYTLPSVPVLTDIVLPSFIDQNVSPPTTAIPIMDFDVPAVAQINDGGLTPEDALIQATKTKLIQNILLGGTMLNPTIEAAIWNRELERDEQALQDAIDKMTKQWAKLGWSLPNGVLAGTVLAINNEYINKRLTTSKDISIKQAEMEQLGLFKSIEIATSLEQLLLANQNDYAKRVFETSKATADVTIEIFKTRVARYNAMLETFKADVEGYKAAISAELQRAEVYKAKLTGAQIMAGIDETRIKVYSAQIGACQQLVDLYKTGVQATATMYEAEKTKIEGYKAKVDAYTSKIEAITKKYMLGVEGFKAYVQAYAATADVQTKVADLNLKGQVATAEARIKEWETQLKLVQENVSMRLEALKTVAQTSSNMVAGALSAMHISLGQSLSDSTEVSHNYNY